MAFSVRSFTLTTTTLRRLLSLSSGTIPAVCLFCWSSLLIWSLCWEALHWPTYLHFTQYINLKNQFLSSSWRQMIFPKFSGLDLLLSQNDDKEGHWNLLTSRLGYGQHSDWDVLIKKYTLHTFSFSSLLTYFMTPICFLGLIFESYRYPQTGNNLREEIIPPNLHVHLNSWVR